MRWLRATFLNSPAPDSCCPKKLRSITTSLTDRASGDLIVNPIDRASRPFGSEFRHQNGRRLQNQHRATLGLNYGTQCSGQMIEIQNGCQQRAFNDVQTPRTDLSALLVPHRARVRCVLQSGRQNKTVGQHPVVSEYIYRETRFRLSVTIFMTPMVAGSVITSTFRIKHTSPGESRAV